MLDLSNTIVEAKAQADRLIAERNASFDRLERTFLAARSDSGKRPRASNYNEIAKEDVKLIKDQRYCLRYFRHKLFRDAECEFGNQCQFKHELLPTMAAKYRRAE